MPKRHTRLSKPFRIGILALALSLAAMTILGTGCGNSSSSGNTTSGTTGGHDFDGGTPANLTETEACAAYVISVCERRNECLGTTESCIDAVAYCPDLLFAEGSTRSASSTWQCAKTMRTRSCEDVVTGRIPDCVEAGNRAVGESCIAAAQCTSLQCTGSPLECGRCIEKRKHGEACSATAACVPGLICTSEGICAEPSRENLEDRLAQAPHSIDETCVGTERCIEGSYCRLVDGSAVGRCSPEVPLDEQCESTSACIPTTYCSIESMRCRALPSIGARCGNDVSLNVLIWCDATSYCNDETERCTPLPTMNEPCATNEQLGNVPSLCDTSSYCDLSREPPTCAALGGAGQACEGETCMAGLTCACKDTGCASRACSRLRNFGESCTAEGDRCPPNVSSCVDGVCQPNAAQGLFAKLCTPS
ncbi:MAG: hypothetical protein QM784_23385 [Polyangiaceae bacterium]